MHPLETQICGLGLLGKKKEPEKVNKEVLINAHSLLSLKVSSAKQDWKGTKAQERETAGPGKDH